MQGQVRPPSCRIFHNRIYISRFASGLDGEQECSPICSVESSLEHSTEQTVATRSPVLHKSNHARTINTRAREEVLT